MIIKVPNTPLHRKKGIPKNRDALYITLYFDLFKKGYTVRLSIHIIQAYILNR